MALLLELLTARSAGLRKEKLKQLLGAVGHGPGWAQKLRAELLARGTRRADRVAQGPARLAQRCGRTGLDGLRVMEFGVGHVLSVPICYWLAGAREVVATDYFAILDLPASRRALVRANRNELVKRLSETASPDLIEERLASLLDLKHWTYEALAELGIHYRAPLDAAQPMPSVGKFDVICSSSVMEHVPISVAGDIFSNLQAILTPGGCQIHTIHLEDHRDLKLAPFAFLGADDDYRENECDARGNRLRASDWIKLATQVAGTRVNTLATRVNKAGPIPERLAPKFQSYALEDLRTASITLSLRAPV